MALSPTSSRSSSSGGGGAGVDGWTDASGTPFTFASATTFTTATDTTLTFTPGTLIKLTNSTVKYFVVVSSSFSATTTVTVTGGTDYTLANAAISAPFYSYQANPQGFPGWFNYTPTLTGGTSPSTTCRFAVVGRIVTVELFGQISTSNATTFTATLPIPSAATNIASEATSLARDNTGTFSIGLISTIAGAQTIVNLYTGPAGGGAAWTNTGLKSAQGHFVYEI